ncbi:putative portal vertex protein [Yersinia mollaretii]|nr:putative portal vertex protein [Yersinia mollaretii]
MDQYWFVTYEKEDYALAAGSVFHLAEPDIHQEIYGLPGYLAAHRVPPQLMGIMPTNTSGFGDVEKAAKVFAINELYPIMEDLKALNDWLGVEVFRFNPYALAAV